MVLSDLSALYANINVDEGDIPKIVPGQPIDFTVDALSGAAITGKVERISPISDATAAVITYPVHVKLDSTTQAIRAGMTVNANIHVREVDNVLRVPNNYVKVTAATGQATVNLVNPDGTTVTAGSVRAGPVRDDRYRINHRR